MFKVTKKIFLLSFIVSLVYFFVNYVFVQNGSAEGSTVVKLVSFNERRLFASFPKSESYDAMNQSLELMGLYDPDILLLQEHYQTKKSFSDAIIKDSFGLKYYVLFEYVDDSAKFGMAIYSKFPIEDIQKIKLRPLKENRSLGLVKIKIDNRILNVGVVHFPNTDMRDDHVNRKNLTLMFLLKEFFGANIRSKQAKHLVDLAKDMNGSPFVIGGDFNTVPLSRAWRLMHGAFVDGFSITSMFNGTRSVQSGAEVKIDHFFHTKSIESIESSVGSMQGSDHRPVIMKIRF